MKRLDTKNNLILRIQEAAEECDKTIVMSNLTVPFIFVKGALSESAKQYWYGVFCDDMNSALSELQKDQITP